MFVFLQSWRYNSACSLTTDIWNNLVILPIVFDRMIVWTSIVIDGAKLSVIQKTVRIRIQMIKELCYLFILKSNLDVITSKLELVEINHSLIVHVKEPECICNSREFRFNLFLESIDDFVDRLMSFHWASIRIMMPRCQSIIDLTRKILSLFDVYHR